MDCLLVISNFPSIEVARQIGTKLVGLQLAACVNLIPAIESIYQWNGKIETEKEVMAFFKTTSSRYDEFEKTLLTLHPYEVPEIIALPLEKGHQDYLSWVRRGCSPSPPHRS